MTVYAEPRETWLERVVAHYGEPHHLSGDKVVRITDELGSCLSRSWLWFPESINHCVSIRHYDSGPQEFWVLRVSTQKKFATRAQIKTVHEPTDEQIKDTLELCLFFDNQQEVADQVKDEELLAVTLEAGTM